MIVVDSSVWIAYFQDDPEDVVQKFESVLQSDESIGILSIIQTEVLMGFQKDKDFSKAQKVLEKVPVLPISENAYIESAQLYRRLRKKGVTVRGSIDCLIAQVCMNAEAFLFTLDKDFKNIAKHTDLKLFD